jgi:ubiquitin-activating enzyme E1
MAVGAVGIEIIKYLLNKKIDSYKNMTSNLALPYILFNTPSKPILNTDK